MAWYGLSHSTGVVAGGIFNLQAEPIEEWLVTERRRLRTIAIEGLVQLLEYQQRTGAREEAMQTALRLLNIDPLQEAVHRSLMRLYHDAGNTAQALWQYGICEKVLRRELNVEPEGTTKSLRRASPHGPARPLDPPARGVQGQTKAASPSHGAARNRQPRSRTSTTA